jgi:hypothetical protein
MADEVKAGEKRQRELVFKIEDAVTDRKGVPKRLIRHFIPFGRHGSFCPPPMPLNDNFLDSRMCDAAWWAVGSILGEFPILDHAWLFGPSDGAKEPWGFVTEPYTTYVAASVAVERARRVTDEWGVGYFVFDRSLSSWNPGQCTPIVAYVRSGYFRVFITAAIKWMLDGG